MISRTTPGFVSTKCSQFIKPASDFKVVVHSNKKKSISKNHLDQLKPVEDTNFVDMKKTRFEVYKFSKSDLNFSCRQKSNVELAIQLGAKPKKEKGVNYKQFKAERQVNQQKKEEERFVKQITQNFKNKISNNKKSFKSGILSTYGKAKTRHSTKRKS